MGRGAGEPVLDQGRVLAEDGRGRQSLGQRDCRRTGLDCGPDPGARRPTENVGVQVEGPGPGECAGQVVHRPGRHADGQQAVPPSAPRCRCAAAPPAAAISSGRLATRDRRSWQEAWVAARAAGWSPARRPTGRTGRRCHTRSARRASAHCMGSYGAMLGCAFPIAVRRHSRREIAAGLVDEGSEQAGQQVHFDVLTDTRFARAPPTRPECRSSRPCRSARRPAPPPAFCASPSRLAGDAHQATDRLGHEVVARQRCPCAWNRIPSPRHRRCRG
jgi:hypothetical protein